MKKTIKAAAFTLVILGITIGFHASSFAQQFTGSQKTEIIIKTDSLINLYNTYGTFFEEVGYCSSIAAGNYVRLFEKDAILFDDLDIKDHQLKTGLFIQDYIEKARIIFPECLRKAEFKLSERGNPVQGKNNNFLVTLTGEKEIMAITDPEKLELYRHTFNNYQITIAFDKDLKNFRIENTGIKGLPISPPPPPVDVSFIVRGPDGRPMPEVSVELKLDGAEFQRTKTDENGEVSFRKLPSNVKQVSISAVSLENPDLKFSDSRLLQEIKDKKILISVAEEKPIALKVHLQDAKSKEKISQAYVIITWAGKEIKRVTDNAGFCEAEINSGARNITIWAYAEGYISQSINIRQISPGRPIRIELKREPLPQYFRASLYSGVMLTNKEVPQHGNFNSWQMNSNKPLLGLNLGYEIFPKLMKLTFLDLGLFGQLTFAKQQFDLKAASASCSVDNFIDPDKSNGTLNMSIDSPIDKYSLLNTVLSAGIVAHYQLIPGMVALHASIGPSLLIIPSLTHDFAAGNSAFYGTYGNDFFGTPFYQLTRYGYNDVASSKMIMQKSLKSLGVGITLQAGGLYTLNDKIGLSLEITYSGLINNMLYENDHNYLAYIQYLDESSAPKIEYQYFGMLNSQDSFRWANLGIQLGVRYTFKSPKP